MNTGVQITLIVCGTLVLLFLISEFAEVRKNNKNNKK